MESLLRLAACARVLLGVLALGLIAPAGQAQSRAESEASALEERLHAPCCRDQMLEAHESPSVTELRRELRQRFERGETREQVEQALVARYGPSIIAVPEDRDPRGGLSVALTVLLGGTAVALLVLGRRWVRRTRAAARAEGAAPRATPQAGDPARRALDERLQAELERLEAET